MLVSARKVLWLCCLLIFPLHSAIARVDVTDLLVRDGFQTTLEGIKAISYFANVEQGIGGDGCKIDWANLNTSLEFVANQSTNLKIVDTGQFIRRREELISQASDPSLSDADKAAAKKAVDDFGYACFLHRYHATASAICLRWHGPRAAFRMG